MNIDNLEKLARAAVEHNRLNDIPNQVNSAYVRATNPSAVLEFIDQYRELAEALAGLDSLRGPFPASDSDIQNKWDKCKKALARANGESNE